MLALSLAVAACGSTSPTQPGTSATASTSAVPTTPTPVPAPLTAPPGTPAADDARTTLRRLEVAEPVDLPTFDADAFGTWIDTDGNNCSQRVDTLSRWTRYPSTAGCMVTGVISEPYGNDVLRVPDEMYLDHVVSLEVAWASGASGWDADRRQVWFNDGGNLVPTSLRQVEAKNGAPVNAWMPGGPDTVRCTYAIVYVATKSAWRLTVTPAERDALTAVLDLCEPLPSSAASTPATTAVTPTG